MAGESVGDLVGVERPPAADAGRRAEAHGADAASAAHIPGRDGLATVGAGPGHWSASQFGWLDSPVAASAGSSGWPQTEQASGALGALTPGDSLYARV